MSDWEWHPERPEGDRWVELGAPEPETTLLTVATPADILTAGGILRAPEVIELAAAAGLDLAAAAVVLLKESGGGNNVWGHDHVVIAPNTYAPGAIVTKPAYLAYKQAVLAGRAGRQGCGALQLTWGGYQDQADALAGCWDWRSNVTVGFAALAAHIRNGGMRGGFRDYNGSGPAAEAYADDAMARYLVWRTRLGTPEPNGNSMVSVWDRKEGPWGGGITDIPDPVNGEQYDLFEFVKRNNVEIYQGNLMLEQLLNAPKSPAPQLRLDVDKLANNLAAHPALAALTAPANDPLLTASFWAQTGERAFKSVAGSLVSVWGASGALNLFSIPWQSTVGVALGAGVLSVLMSVMSAPVGPLGSPSLVGKPQ